MIFTGFDYITVGVCIIDETFTFLFWNRRLEEWTGKKRNSVVGKELGELFPHFKEEKYRKRIEGLFHGGPPVILSSQLHKNLFFARTVTGETSIQQATISAYPSENGLYYAIFSIEDITDISERIAAYRKMRDTAHKALAEKNDLFREMHHRIKNNLYMVSSLIDIEMSKTREKRDLHALKTRINTIKLVHEKLYQNDEGVAIDLELYIHEILRAVFPGNPQRQVRIDCRIPRIFLEAGTAIPLGLIINEIATNAVKHGFAGTNSPLFSVLLHRDEGEGRYCLVMSNNGSPFPEHIDLDNPTSIGLQLITSLTRQLEGTIGLKGQPNPEFTLLFPVKNSKI